MKNLSLKQTLQVLTLSAGISLISAVHAQASTTTTINSITITNAQLLDSAAYGGGIVYQALIAGKVAFTGAAPVFVTINTGGLSYTAPTDQSGNFSFFVYTNGDGQYQYTAWSPNAAQPVTGTRDTFVNNK